jgi:hypothetical protein
MKKIEEFAVNVATILSEKPRERVVEAFGALDEDQDTSQFDSSILLWIEFIIEIVTEVIERCPNNNRTITETICRPGIVNRILFRRQMRDKMPPCCPNDVRIVERAMIDTVEVMGEEAVQELVNETKRKDYWLI